ARRASAWLMTPATSRSRSMIGARHWRATDIEPSTIARNTPASQMLTRGTIAPDFVPHARNVSRSIVSDSSSTSENQSGSPASIFEITKGTEDTDQGWGGDA